MASSVSKVPLYKTGNIVLVKNRVSTMRVTISHVVTILDGTPIYAGTEEVEYEGKKFAMEISSFPQSLIIGLVR
jgi:hypothetical protein